jgi:hypothetical protein
MKIQEASKDVTKGEIMFPISKTSYMEANTQKEEEIGVMEPNQHSHVLDTKLCVNRHMRRRLTHASRCLAPETPHTCA